MDFFEVIKNRRSIRKYQDKNVEKDAESFVSCTTCPFCHESPTLPAVCSSNKEILSRINSVCNQDWRAPIMIAMVSTPKEAWIRDDREEFWKADAAIAMNQVFLAAFAVGLGTCWIAAFKENEVKEILA